ncbi:MAG TPA: hypothetical protein VGN81_14105 [Pseudonocardiaceae bacterium]|jgi:hypothetical protein
MRPQTLAYALNDSPAGQFGPELRLNAGYFPDNQHITGIIDEMTERSAEFRALWADHNVSGLTRAVKIFVHPEQGPIEPTRPASNCWAAPPRQAARRP